MTGHTRSVHIRFDQYADSTNAIKLDFIVFVITPVAHFGKILATRFQLFVPLGDDFVFAETCRQL